MITLEILNSIIFLLRVLILFQEAVQSPETRVGLVLCFVRADLWKTQGIPQDIPTWWDSISEFCPPCRPHRCLVLGWSTEGPILRAWSFPVAGFLGW